MAVQLSNQIFSISIGDYGDISSLRLTGDTFNTNYVMNGSNAPKQNTSDHQWLGELMFTYRLGNGAWTRAWTSNSADVRQIISSGNSVQVSYQNSSNHQGIRNFTLQETYSLVNDYLHWQMKVTNTSNQALEIGDWGLPLPFNEYWSGGNNEQIYETRVLSHSFVGHHSSFITAGRPSGIGPYILLLPDAATGAGLEYQDHWRVEEHPGSTWAMEQGGWSEGLNVFYIHSNVIKSTNRGYIGSTSLSLAPGESKTYAFKFYKVTDEQAVKDRLYSEGHVDVTVVPGMIVPTNLKAKFDLHTRKSITSVTAQYPSETTISYLENAPTNHKIYELTLGRLGHNNITVNYGNGEKTVLQFYAIEPVDTALQRHSTFMVNSTQWNVPGDLRDKVFDDWMMQYKTKRNSFAGYWGWGDDWGLTHGQFLAEKNVQKPVASEIKAVDDYLEVAIWTNLMEGHHTDYLVPDFLMPQPNTTPTYRGYAYPHIYNTFFSMYKLAKLYPNLVSYRNSKNTYLLRAYRIFKALYEGPVAYNWNTGLMGELTTPDMIKALQEEGLTTEANDMIAKMATKYNNFKNTTYPYGSEYNYDNTGEEAVYTLAKMNSNTTMMSKINAKTRAARGHMPVWYYYADPVTITGENWWNFQYTTSLAGYAMDDWTRRYSSKPEVDQRLSYAAKLANIGAINSGQISPDPANIGAVSWTYQAGKGNYGALGLDGGPLFNGWRGMSGEADLGLFGAIKILSSDVAVDPIFGLFGYGCDVAESNNSYTVTPKDGVFQRLHLITQKLSLELNRDQYTLAVVSKSKNNIRLMLKNTTPGTAHITTVTITGLATGTYDVLVDGTKTGSVTAVNSAATTTSLNIGTAANYDIRIQSSTGNPAPAGDIIAHYEFNETAGSTAADSSGYGQQASVIGGSWSAGRNGNALRLNGIGAYASLPGGIVSSLNDFTIAAWVRVNTHNGWARLFDFGAGTDRYMFLTPKAEGTGMRFAITVLGNGEEQQLNAPELATGVWKHVAVTLSGTTGIMYVDGIEATRNTGMTLRPSSLGLTDWNYIGKSQFDDPYLNGAVDELIIYNRALTAQEIRGLASASSTITAHDLRVQAYAEGAD